MSTALLEEARSYYYTQKDVPDLQFISKTEEKGEIPPSAEVSVMEMSLVSSKQETVKCPGWTDKYGEIPPNTGNFTAKSKSSDLVEKCGKISPQLEMCVEDQNSNLNEQHIAGYTNNLKEQGKIQLKAVTDKEIEVTGKKCTWFQNPVNCMNKWSKALKQGVAKFIGLEDRYTAIANSKGNGKLEFSFFL